jgi:hypothetical protein
VPFILRLTDSCLFSCIVWEFSGRFNSIPHTGRRFRILNRPHFHLPSVMVHKYCLPVNRILQFIQSIRRPIPANTLRLNTMNNRRGEKGVFCRFTFGLLCPMTHIHINNPTPTSHPLPKLLSAATHAKSTNDKSPQGLHFLLGGGSSHQLY